MQSEACGQSLSAERRIRHRTEFDLAFCADRLTNKWFFVYARKNESDLARLGLVVSKKIMSKAVTRNYAKRLVREVFRQDVPAVCGLDIVVRPRQSLSPENANEGRQALKNLLRTLQA